MAVVLLRHSLSRPAVMHAIWGCLGTLTISVPATSSFHPVAMHDDGAPQAFDGLIRRILASFKDLTGSVDARVVWLHANTAEERTLIATLPPTRPQPVGNETSRRSA